MIFRGLKPIPKTEEQLEAERLRAEYEAHFGEPYVFQIGGPAPQTLDELREEIHRLIATDTKQKLVSFPPGMIP